MKEENEVITRKPRILLYDIESLPNVCTTWGLFDQTIPFDSILQEKTIICVSYKWLDEKKIHTIGYKGTSEEELLKEFYEVLQQADIIIAHNGDRFDLPMLNARAITYSINPLPHIVSVDTLKVARKYFRFNSNKLDYLGKFLGCGRKIHNAPGLWLKVLAGDEKALEQMIKYNRQDVIVLEKVYLKLRGYIQNHPNVNIFKDEVIFACPNCGSENIQSRGMRVTKTRRYKRYQCTDCGGWSTGNIIK